MQDQVVPLNVALVPASPSPSRTNLTYNPHSLRLPTDFPTQVHALDVLALSLPQLKEALGVSEVRLLQVCLCVCVEGEGGASPV